MEEINLNELFKYFYSKLIIIIAIILFTIVCGSLYSIYLKKPMYNSKTTMLLVSNDSGQSFSQTEVNLNKSLIDNYIEIAKSDRVIGEVIENLDLNYSIDELLKNISVTTVSDTEIIKIVVNDKNPKVAQKIANEIVSVFTNVISDIYELRNISQIDKAVVSKTPYNINIVKDEVIYLLVGLVLSFGLTFVLFYFDTGVKSSNEIESKFGISVIGVVPFVNKK